MKDKSILVGITGSIAAYKGVEIVSKLVQEGALVDVVMTESAKHFVGPLTFQALTRRKVYCQMFDLSFLPDPGHISLAERAELALISPATANVIGKLANGIADDLLTSTMLAVRCPVLIAPAMNDKMYTHPAVQQNIQRLKQMGYNFVDPEEGYLACGIPGVGRLASIDKILLEVHRLLANAKDKT
jgi:phosphopantothenoylcysteine decarboxylase/phosphopantothenate--cysteine ligase